MEQDRKYILDKPTLREMLSEGIDVLTTLFDASQAELEKFKPYRIRRTRGMIVDSNYPNPSYNPKTVFFSFPVYFWTEGEHQARIIHEAAHYVHHMINPLAYPIKVSRERRNLNEIVADYANLIFNMTLLDQIFARNSCKIYGKMGLEFLPELARMSLEEAMAKELVV